MEFTSWLALDVDALQLLPGAEAQLNPSSGAAICSFSCNLTCTVTEPET